MSDRPRIVAIPQVVPTTGKATHWTAYSPERPQIGQYHAATESEAMRLAMVALDAHEKEAK